MIFDLPTMYGTIFVAGALGYRLNLVFVFVEKWFAHWGGKRIAVKPSPG